MTGGDLGVGLLEVSAALRQFLQRPVGVVDVGDEHEIGFPASLFVAFFTGQEITGRVVDADVSVRVVNLDQAQGDRSRWCLGGAGSLARGIRRTNRRKWGTDQAVTGRRQRGTCGRGDANRGSEEPLLHAVTSTGRIRRLTRPAVVLMLGRAAGGR